jgi:hypothetical protein
MAPCGKLTRTWNILASIDPEKRLSQEFYLCISTLGVEKQNFPQDFKHPLWKIGQRSLYYAALRGCGKILSLKKAWKIALTD